MSIEFTLPALGENIEKGDVVRVLVSAGDVIQANQPVLELETDKATIEVPSSVAGTVKEVRAKAGDKLKVGQVVLVLDEAKAPEASVAPVPGAAAGQADRAAAKPEPAAAPANVDPAPAAKPAARVPVAEPARHDVIDISSARPAARTTDARPTTTGEGGGSVPAAPSVRRFARELGVEIGDVPGTGPGGRIGSEDVKEHVRESMARGGAIRMVSLPDFSKWGDIDVRPMTNIRRKTAEHLSVAWQAPHVTQHDRADVTALEAFRATYAGRVEKAGGKLTVTAILLRVVAQALARFPQFAASVDMASQAIIFKKYCHVGVAVDTPNGLLVPVVRDANRKTITEIAVELATLSQKARDKKLTLDEMTGSVFSITNLGGIGGTSFTPIINQPEVAILGVSRTTTEPVWKDGAFAPRAMLPLSLSYDHRAIDGADAARFLRFVADALEDPMTMLL